VRDFPLGSSPDRRKRAEEWLARPDGWVPAEPRPAATVMLVRDGPAGVEAFMLRRAATMAFAPTMMVFPGGGVDRRDADLDLPWAGPTPGEWAGRLQCDEATARELVAAAVRELFEECGVLLAGPSADTLVGDVRGEQWQRERQRLLSRERSLSQVLRERGLVLRSDLLGYRSHWITPEFEPRRYDTRFFSALVPQGQAADDQSSEAETAEWVRAADLLASPDAMQALMTPTKVCVEEIAAAPTAADFVAERVRVTTVAPVLAQTPGGLVIRADVGR
jgi:8-oxo-dGTP pyrophosphatase MutT (NUDIX family)